MSKRARRKKKAESVSKRSSPPPPPPDFFSENWRAIAALAIVLILAVVTIWAVTQVDWGDNNEPNGNGKDVAPAFNLTDIDGELFSLEVFKGRIVVLDLFATWCGPCRLQMEELNELRTHYPDGLVVILSVDVDQSETSQVIRDFRDEYTATWKFASDTDDLSTKYDASNIPTMVIIDQEGNIAWRHQGTTTFEDLMQLIDPLLQSG